MTRSDSMESTHTRRIAWCALILLTAMMAACGGSTQAISGTAPSLVSPVATATDNAGSFNLLIGVAVGPVAASHWQIAAALAVGALGYGASIALSIRSAQQLGAVRAQAVFASAPFLGAVISYAVLGEAVGASAIVAAALLVASVSLLFGGVHAHLHRHPVVEHVHSHRHDDGHHLHEHPGLPAGTRHVHPHRHEELAHAHPHWSDLHHRHEH